MAYNISYLCLRMTLTKHESPIGQRAATGRTQRAMSTEIFVGLVLCETRSWVWLCTKKMSQEVTKYQKYVNAPNKRLLVNVFKSFSNINVDQMYKWIYVTMFDLLLYLDIMTKGMLKRHIRYSIKNHMNNTSKTSNIWHNEVWPQGLPHTEKQRIV